ncbi:hypothetical protein [Sphaerisporangium corydalis]|uniref:Uncharacterized protein n=1 Tax=Sphaerisporangium corydalis TaxID=1441875 RepID=A0ABV9E8I5_9ACTN|nr:hypothetical protein [Sphaerisporangium corydalis]
MPTPSASSRGADEDSAGPFTGEAAGGRVRATARDGRLSALELDPRVMRMTADELGGHLLAAITAALGAYRPTVGSQEPLVDLAALAASMRDVRDLGLRRMDTITQDVEDAVALLRDGARVSGGVDPSGLAHLLAEAVRDVERAAGAPPPDGGRPASGDDKRATAADDDQVTAADDERVTAGRGDVRAAVAGGRVEWVELGRAAMRTASSDLAELVVAVVNRALDRAGARARDRVADLDERAEEVRELSLRQMEGLTRSLTGLMNSIEPA